MSVNYKAQLVAGYELANNWNEFIDDEFYERYEEYFLWSSLYRDGPVIFGVVLDEVDEGSFIEYDSYIAKEDMDILNEFTSTFSGAIVYHSLSHYLICKEC
jgi:hypothetical protein